MKLFEWQGKRMLSNAHIPVPPGELAASPSQARMVAEKIGYPVVIKAQVLTGSRKKAGGIVFANNGLEVENASEALLNSAISGFPVRQVLVEKKIDVDEEWYVAIVLDEIQRAPLILLSRYGGIDIENILTTSPDGLIRFYPDILKPFCQYQARQLCRRMGLEGRVLLNASAHLYALYALFRNYKLNLLEINPFVLTASKDLVAVDAVIRLDDEAFPRFPDLIEELQLEIAEERPRPATQREIMAREIDAEDHKGVCHYVDLDADGDIGIVTTGGGFSLAFHDLMLDYGLSRSNYCDSSGDPSADKVCKTVKLVLSQPNIKGFMFVSGIINQPLDVTATGIVKAYDEVKPQLPFLVRLAGNRDVEALRILKGAGIQHSYGREVDESFCVMTMLEMLKQGRGA